MIEHKASGLAPRTIKFYREYLRRFLTYCDANEVKLVLDVSADLLRRYLLLHAESHNPGGAHAAYRCLRALFIWLTDEELIPTDWKNPMRKVKAPKVNMAPVEPIALEDVRA